MGEEKGFILLYGKKEVPWNEKVFGKGGETEQKLFKKLDETVNKATKIAKKALDGK